MNPLRTIKTIIICAVIFSSLLFSQKHPRSLTFQKASFNPPSPVHVPLKKGIDLYYREAHEIPVIKLDIILKFGTMYEPPGKEGLASLTYQLLKNGSTKQYSREMINETLDFLGSQIEMRITPTSAFIKFWALRKNFKKSWDILTDILRNPLFESKQVEDEKKKSLELIRKRWDSWSNIGFIVFNELVYGSEYPEKRRMKSKSINAISRDDVKAFYEEYINNTEINLAVSGDFEPDQLIPEIRKSFADWTVAPREKIDFPPAKLASKPGIYLVHKEGMTQAMICMGHLGVNWLDSDNAEVNILNFIYGEHGFNSRLAKEIRVNRGLAYNIFGSVDKGRDRGLFRNICVTKNESVSDAIKAIKDIMLDFTRSPVTADELKTALEHQENAFVHLYDTPHRILVWKIIYKMRNFPDDYLETYLQRIRKIDEQKILKMSRRMIHPEKMIVLVVGDKNKVYDQLKTLNSGEINELTLEQE